MTGVPALAAAGAAAGEGGSAVLVGEGGAAALATAADLLSGPVGWAILGGTAVVGAAVAAASIYNAHSKAQANLKPADTAQPCHDCGDRPDCFTPPDRKDPEKLKEFRRQLKGQQDGINKMSPQDVIDGIKKYKAGGREAFPGEADMRKTFRDQAKKAALRAARRNGLSKAEAEQAARDALAGKAALHNPDLTAGGLPEPTDLGDASINSSIGSQWAKPKPGSKSSRSDQLL